MFVFSILDKINNSQCHKVTLWKIVKEGMECMIIDSGKGFVEPNTPKNRPSKGIHSAKERLALLEGTNGNPITIQHDKNEGTTVIIRLKV